MTALAMKFDVRVSEGGDSLSVDVEVELTIPRENIATCRHHRDLTHACPFKAVHAIVPNSGSTRLLFGTIATNFAVGKRFRCRIVRQLGYVSGRR